MTAYRLHYFPESGNSYKLALMLTLCGETFEPVWTDFGGGVTRTPQWRASVNAMGEIPVLEADGARLTQTAPILLQLAERYGQFGASTPDEQYELLRWLFWDNHKLTGYVAPYRYQRMFMATPNPQVLAYLRRRIEDYLSILDGHLRSRAFMLGERPTIADISTMVYLSYPDEETGFDLANSHPAIYGWLRRLAGLRGWQAPYDLLPGARLVQHGPAAHP